MKEELCERCELIVGLGCCCPTNGAAPRAERPASPIRREWRGFPADTILISPTRYAHLPGACTHLEDEYIKAPRWGWIPDPPSGLWDRLNVTHPATATEGNTARQAVVRCSACQKAVS